MSNLDTDFWDREEIENSNTEDDIYTGAEEFKDEIEEIPLGIEDDEYSEDEEMSVVDNARIRLEQGRLYEMLIKHDLFDGVDAMPQAIDKVQSEIKEFIVERLEILLGMKAEKEKIEVRHIKESQFNDVEVQALKMIARKVTKGVSDSAPLESAKPRNELNTVRSNPVRLTKPQTITQNKAPTKLKASLPQKPVAKKTAISKKELITKQPIKNDSVEELAKQDIKYIESLKKMSLEEAGQVVAEKYARPKSPVKIDQESVNRLYTSKMAVNQTAQTFAALLAAAKRK